MKVNRLSAENTIAPNYDDAAGAGEMKKLHRETTRENKVEEEIRDRGTGRSLRGHFCIIVTCAVLLPAHVV